MSDAERDFGFAAFKSADPLSAQKSPSIRYQLHGKPYRWAQYRDVPFTPLQKPLAESRVALVTTAAPYQPDKGDQGPGAPYNSAAKFYTVYTEARRANLISGFRISVSIASIRRLKICGHGSRCAN